MNDYTRKNMRNRKRRIERRLGDRHWTDQVEPMFSASNIQYEMGRADAGHIGWWYRDDATGGAADRADRSHRQGRACVEAAPAVSRVGSRAEHRLQRLERRNVPGRHRTAAATMRCIWMRWERNGFRIRRRRETSAGDSRPTTWSV